MNSVIFVNSDFRLFPSATLPTSSNFLSYFTNLFKFEWELYKGPGGANQWRPKGGEGADLVPLAQGDGKTHPIMLTTDLSLRMDPDFAKISKRFHENPDVFADAYARAWYKLTHRDMGPVRRCLGGEVPPEQIWQDPITPPAGKPITAASATKIIGDLLGSGVTPVQMVRTAWASACTYRHTDFRGGANGARIRLAPQKDWAVNNPQELSFVLGKYEGIMKGFNGSAPNGEFISMADTIVLAGIAGVEECAKLGGNPVNVEFSAGRGDATDEQTDVKAFSVLEPTSDAFRNYNATPYQMVDRAHLLELSAPEMAVLVAGMRAMGATATGDNLGVLTEKPGALTNDFFINLCSMDYKWEKNGNIYDGKDRATGALKWRASACDLAFGSNAELRAIAEQYACDDAKQDFADMFASTWAKVMNNDMYDGRWR